LNWVRSYRRRFRSTD